MGSLIQEFGGEAQTFRFMDMPKRKYLILRNLSSEHAIVVGINDRGYMVELILLKPSDPAIIFTIHKDVVIMARADNGCVFLQADYTDKWLDFAKYIGAIA